MRYEPGIIADANNITTEALVVYLQDELRSIAAAFADTAEGHTEALGAEPSKPRTGQIVYTNGTTWNPGQGAGVYVYNGTSWVLLGANGLEQLYLYNEIVGGL